MSVKARKTSPIRGTAVVWPPGCRAMFDISAPTMWRWEKAGRLPPRDVNIGGRTGWKPETLAAVTAAPRAR